MEFDLELKKEIEKVDKDDPMAEYLIKKIKKRFLKKKRKLQKLKNWEYYWFEIYYLDGYVQLVVVVEYFFFDST